MGVRRKKRAHSGVRLSKLPVPGGATSPSRRHQQQHELAMAAAALDPAFACCEVPDEVLAGTELDLSLWSVVARDSCLQRLARRLDPQLAAAHSTNQFADAARAALTPMTASSQQRPPSVVALNLAGAENITDQAALAIGSCCPALRHLVLEKAVQLTDAGVRHIVSCCRQLQTLNLNYVIALQGGAVGAIGELQLPLRELGLAGCSKVPAFALQRVFHACPALERLDLSFCGAVSDELLLSLGQHCRRLQWLKLRGCRQVSDAGVVGLANGGGGGELLALDLARFDLQYKLNDISLLALAERCRVLETLALAGCEMLTDVGISWLCSGCAALTRLDLSGCAKLTDVAMRAVGESLLQLRHLDVSHCVRVSDVGLRHLAAGCPELAHVDAVGLALLADPRAHGGDSSRFQGVAALALRCAKLRHLDVSRCAALGDGALLFLAAHACALAELNVSGCARVTTAGVYAVLAARAATLTALDVSGCEKVADSAFALRPPPTALTSALPLRQLASLRLRNCSLVSDATLASLGGLGLALRDLDLSGCARVGDVGLLALVDAPALAEALRRLWLRELGEVTETGVSWLAERCRKLLLLDVTGCARVKAFSLKALAGCWKFATYAHSERFRGMAPKHRAEDWLVVEQYGDCWRAATRIQSLFRARAARRVAAQKREEKLVNWVATRLQSVFRGRQARRRAVLARLQRDKEAEAAKRIQTKFRQRRAGEHVARVREARRRQQLDDAARLLQLAWRRKRVRAKLQTRALLRLAREEQRQRAASTLQRAWRGKQARTHTSVLRVARAAKDQEERAAANKMQSLFRARAARREVARKRQALRDEDARRERAALRLQTHVRRRRAQKELLARVRRAKRLNDAAACIQRRWRAKKRWFASQLVVLARRRAEEHAAAVKLQAAWKRRQGRAEVAVLRLVREHAQQRVEQAALRVQTQWRAKCARERVAAAKQLALEKVLQEARLQHRAAALVQAHFRGRRGRERYRELVLLKKRRWKEVVQPESGQTFYYNKETGEVRFRRPQDMLDLLPKPPCDNCVSPAAHIAQVECKDCGEMFCHSCWASVHAGGRRRRHAFRSLYDFYDRRVDYGDGEFPSAWPSEVEQDEKDGWGLRVFPRRQPAETREAWERYVDAATGREWFYNKNTEASSYSPPSVFDPATAAEAADGDGDGGEWSKHYDETQSAAYYYNSRTLESTFARPADFETARRAPSARGSDWEKYVDPASGSPYYYNSQTSGSTYARPAGFQTARRGGAVAIEAGGSDWAKYYDLTQGLYYYYNARTLESSFARPPEFATPRVGLADAAALGMAEFYDVATAKAYFFNAQTAECQAAAASASASASVQARGYR